MNIGITRIPSGNEFCLTFRRAVSAGDLRPQSIGEAVINKLSSLLCKVRIELPSVNKVILKRFEIL